MVSGDGGGKSRGRKPRVEGHARQTDGGGVERPKEVTPLPPHEVMALSQASGSAGFKQGGPSWSASVS